MADRNTLRSDRRDEVDTDPFADLARIIGFDPRVKMRAASSGAAAPANQPEKSPQLPAETPEPELSPEFMAEWDDAFADADLTVRDEALAAPTEVEVERVSGPAFEAEDEAEPLEATVPAGQDEASPLPQRTADRFDPETFETAAEIDLVTQAFERAWEQTNQWSTEIEAKDLRTEISLPREPLAHPEPVEARRDEEPAAEADDLAHIDLFDEDLDDVLAESIELDLGDAWLDVEEEAAEAPAEPPVQEASAEMLELPPVAEAAQPEWRVEDEAASEEALPDFEDELRALLGDDAAQAARLSSDHDAPRREEPRSTHEAPESPDFDEALIAELTAPEPTASLEPEELPAPVEASPAPADESFEPEHAGHDPEQPEAQAAPAAEEPPPVRAAPVAEAPVVRPEPRPRSLTFDVGPLDDDPFAALAAMAERYRSSRLTPVEKPAAASAPQSGPEIEKNKEVEDMKRTPSARYEMPEIETFDVPEKTVAAADDLDFPETPFEEPRDPRARRGVDAEFEDLLEEMSSGEPARQPSYRPNQGGYAPTRPVAAPSMDRAPAARGYEQPRAAAQAAVQPGWEMEPQSRSQASSHEAQDEEFFTEDDMTSIADADDEAPPPRKRGKWLAALFGSVVIAGGAGAFAMKFTGIADGGLPMLVKADATPMKVRPDKPGGAVVPNQENEVYDRVAGNASAAPAQERLLTSAEEPVSLDETADDTSFEDDGLPGFDMGEEIDAAPEAKAEDRMDEAAVEAPRPSEDPIAVTPRKVRTVAVRADGTIVEDTAASPVETLVADASQTIDKVRQGSADVDTTGSTNSIAPAPVDDQAAVAPVSAESGPKVVEAQATAGTWSMQIASQPSEDAARSSYADLARRYSALLGGRDVNIVKTEISGKGTFWRVRVPAETRSAAVDLCTNFKAAGGTCFVSK